MCNKYFILCPSECHLATKKTKTKNTSKKLIYHIESHGKIYIAIVLLYSTPNMNHSNILLTIN